MNTVVQFVVMFVVSVAFFGVALFLPAGTFHYWQAWVYLAVFVATTLFPSIYLAVRYPAAPQRRMKGGPTAETRPVQRVVMVATIAAVVLQLVVSALDRRFGWSSVPGPVVIGGAVLVGVGLLVRAVRRGSERLCRSHHHGRSRPAPGVHRPLRRDPPPDVPRCPGDDGRHCACAG
ncbi:MAG: hypothetical protein M3O32_15235, partial [Actinomycetota bacterium]|nr:hypothetical protein [Actinomycetota bacterium]